MHGTTGKGLQQLWGSSLSLLGLHALISSELSELSSLPAPYMISIVESSCRPADLLGRCT